MEHIKLINNYVDVLLNTDVNSFILKGPAGMSKTSSVLERISVGGLEEGKHYVYYSGYMTPLKLYESLMKCRILEEPKLLIFDDIDAIVKNKTSLAILKSALSEARGKRIVTYESSTSKIDVNSFEFTGKVIIILNNVTNNKDVEPLLDRGIFYDMTIDPVALSQYINENFDSIASDIKKEERAGIWDKIKRFVDYPKFSLRAMKRAISFYRWDSDNWYLMFKRTMEHA